MGNKLTVSLSALVCVQEKKKSVVVLKVYWCSVLHMNGSAFKHSCKNRLNLKSAESRIVNSSIKPYMETTQSLFLF